MIRFFDPPLAHHEAPFIVLLFQGVVVGFFFGLLLILILSLVSLPIEAFFLQLFLVACIAWCLC